MSVPDPDHEPSPEISADQKLRWEIEKLRAESEKLRVEARHALRPAWMNPTTLVAIVTAIISLATAIPSMQLAEVKKQQTLLDLARLSASRDTLQARRDSLLAEQQTLTGTVDGLRGELDRLDSLRNVASAELGDAASALQESKTRLAALPSSAGHQQATQALNRAESRVSALQQVVKSADSSSAQASRLLSKYGTRVFIHIGDSQNAAARQLRIEIEKRGVRVAGIENVVRKGLRLPRGAEVRYFHAEDGAAATVVSAAMADAGYKAESKLLKPARPAAPGTIEVWFPFEPARAP